MFLFKQLYLSIIFSNIYYYYIFLPKQHIWLYFNIKKIYLFNKQTYNTKKFGLRAFSSLLPKYINFLSFFLCKLYLIWRGFKIFLFKKKIYILLGLSHYVSYSWEILDSFFFCKKRKLFFFSWNVIFLKNFIGWLKKLQHLNLYKGKGLFEYKIFKGNIKLKIWKKKH